MQFFPLIFQNILHPACGSAGALLLHFILPLFALPALVCAVVCLIQTVYLEFCQSFIFEATIFFLQSCYSN